MKFFERASEFLFLFLFVVSIFDLIALILAESTIESMAKTSLIALLSGLLFLLKPFYRGES